MWIKSPVVLNKACWESSSCFKLKTQVTFGMSCLSLFTHSEKNTYSHFANGGLLQKKLKVVHFFGCGRCVRGCDQVRSCRHELQHISNSVKSYRKHWILHISILCRVIAAFYKMTIRALSRKKKVLKDLLPGLVDVVNQWNATNW